MPGIGTIPATSLTTRRGSSSSIRRRSVAGTERPVSDGAKLYPVSALVRCSMIQPSPITEASLESDKIAGSRGFLSWRELGPDDLLSVVFWRDQQLSGDVLVRPDGKISLPLLDDVQAAGLTPKQLRDRLVGEARRFVSEPVATVVVRQVNSRKVYITGFVARPGQYALTSAMTALQLI